MREKKTVVIADKIINDDKLSDAEFRLLSRLILKYGTDSPENETVRLKFNNDFEEFHISRSSFFRLLSGLVKREYLQRDSRTDSYSFSRSISKYFSPINETTQSQKSDCETMRRENEEERSKEEDKENSQSDSSYIYNNIKENEKEREIPKREKPVSTDEKPKRSRPPFVKPTVEEVRAYCRERESTVRAEAFVSFYESKGWMVGKNPMKDWKAAVRTWEQKDKESGKFYVPPENRPEADDDLPY